VRLEFENKMKLAQTNLNTKIIIAGIIAAVLVVGLFGCGKSEATKAAEQQATERHDARQEIKDKIAAIKVRTEGSTYSEFRQAELDLKTCYESKKTYLNDIGDEFSKLDKLMTATDFCWSYSIRNPILLVEPGVKWQGKIWETMEFLSPERALIVSNLYLKPSQWSEPTPEFYPKNYIQTGLTKVNNQAEIILNLLDKQK
jgi:hypothetical protein